MFMNPNALWDLAAEDGISAPLELRTEIATLIFGDYGGDTAAASRADIAYRATRVTWVYEVQIARYRRISDGIGHFDANTLDPVTAANVVVLFARHRETDIIESGSGINASRSIEIELWFEGDAMLLRDGVMIAARWARPTRESNMIFTDATGNRSHSSAATRGFRSCHCVKNLIRQKKVSRLRSKLIASKCNWGGDNLVKTGSPAMSNTLVSSLSESRNLVFALTLNPSP